ncbi:MAG: hypothetical protein ACXWFS_11910 [Thermoanaerobaculia bacterium]
MTARMGFWAKTGAWALALLACVGGCVTPTLPPDDPPEPVVELGVGVARLRGHVGSGPALVLVHNRVSDLVFGERTLSGAYDFEVPTQPCDTLAFWYTMGTFQSSAITFRPAELIGPRDACRDAPGALHEVDAGDEP